jgi:YVTN family beta-propeller protein
MVSTTTNKLSKKSDTTRYSRRGRIALINQLISFFSKRENEFGKSCFAFLTTSILAAGCFVFPACATKLSPQLAASLKVQDPHVNMRLDGSVEMHQNDLYLPVLPAKESTAEKVELQHRFPESGKADFLSFSNGWCFLRVFSKGETKTILSGKELPESLDKQLLAGHFPGDLLVPEKFVLPDRLRDLAKDLPVTLKGEVPKNAPINGTIEIKHGQAAATRIAVFVTSPAIGKITLLDEKTLEKIAEFPTEGTPGSLVGAQNKLYITDQSKSRILILDPRKRQFIGQIDLPAKCSPKGIVAVPNGQLLYVSEYTTSNIDVIETATGKVLLKTKVPAGPSRMAITPDGNFILVLNPPACRATLISTKDQKVVGTVVVGTLPNAIAISKDSNTAYVSNRASNTVSIIDIPSKRIAGTLPAGTAPTGIALDHEGKRLFVANAKDSTISVFEVATRKKLEDIKLPPDLDFPGGMMLMPDGKHIIVSSATTEAVGVLNTTDLKFDSLPQVGYPTDQFVWMHYN